MFLFLYNVNLNNISYFLNITYNQKGEAVRNSMLIQNTKTSYWLLESTHIKNINLYHFQHSFTYFFFYYCYIYSGFLYKLWSLSAKLTLNNVFVIVKREVCGVREFVE